jgi:hypothetical protein
MDEINLIGKNFEMPLIPVYSTVQFLLLDDELFSPCRLLDVLMKGERMVVRNESTSSW